MPRPAHKGPIPSPRDFSLINSTTARSLSKMNPPPRSANNRRRPIKRDNLFNIDSLVPEKDTILDAPSDDLSQSSAPPSVPPPTMAPSARLGQTPARKQPPTPKVTAAAANAHNNSTTPQFAENLLEPVTSKDAWDDEIGDIPWDTEASLLDDNSLPIRNNYQKDSIDVGSGNLAEHTRIDHSDTVDSYTGYGGDQKSQQSQQSEQQQQHQEVQQQQQQHQQLQPQYQYQDHHQSQQQREVLKDHQMTHPSDSIHANHLNPAYAPPVSTKISNSWNDGEEAAEPDMWGETDDLDLGWDEEEIPQEANSQASQLPNNAMNASNETPANQMSDNTSESHNDKKNELNVEPTSQYQNEWPSKDLYEPQAEENFWENNVNNAEQHFETEQPPKHTHNYNYAEKQYEQSDAQAFHEQNKESEAQISNEHLQANFDDQKQYHVFQPQSHNTQEYSQSGFNQSYDPNQDHFYGKEIANDKDFKHAQQEYAHIQEKNSHNQEIAENQNGYLHDQEKDAHKHEELFNEHKESFNYHEEKPQNQNEHFHERKDQAHEENENTGSEQLQAISHQDSNFEPAAVKSGDLESSEHGFNQMINDFEKFNVHELSHPAINVQTPQNYEQQNHERHVEQYNTDQHYESINNERALNFETEHSYSHFDQSHEDAQNPQLQDFWQENRGHLEPADHDTLSRKYTLETVAVNEGTRTESPGLQINYNELELQVSGENQTEAELFTDNQDVTNVHNQPNFGQNHVEFGHNDTVIYSPVRKDFVPDESFLPEEEEFQQETEVVTSPKSLELLDLDDDFLLDEDFLDDDLLDDEVDGAYNTQPVVETQENQYTQSYVPLGNEPATTEPIQTNTVPAKKQEALNKYVPLKATPAYDDGKYTGTFNSGFGGFSQYNSGVNSGMIAPAQTNLDLHKIAAEKKKNDAYDFPEGFVKPIKPVTRMKSTPKLPQTEQSAPSSFNQLPPKQDGPPPTTTQKLFFEDLPIVKAPPPAKRPPPVKKEEVPKMPEAPVPIVQPPVKSPKNPYANLKTKQGGIQAPPATYLPVQGPPGLPAGTMAPGIGAVNVPYRSNMGPGPNQPQMMNGAMLPPGPQGPQQSLPSVHAPQAPQGQFGGPIPLNGYVGQMAPPAQTQGKYQPPAVTQPPQNRGQTQNISAPPGQIGVSKPPTVANPPLAHNGQYAPNASNVPHANNALNAPDAPNGSYAPGGKVNAYSPRVPQMDRASSLNVPPSGHGPQIPFPTVHEHRTVSQQSRSYELKSPLDAYIPASGPYTPSAKVSHSRKGSVLAGNNSANPYAIAAHNGPGPMTSTSVRRGTSERAQQGPRQSDPFRADPNTIFRRQLPLFKWGPSDQVVTAIPQMNIQGVSTVLRIARAEELVPGIETYNEFPGPLIKGKTKKKDLEAWLARHLEKLRSSGSSPDEVTLAEVLNVLVESDGAFLSDKVQKDIAAVLAPHVDFSPESNIHVSGVAAGALNAHRLDSAGSNIVWNYVQSGNTHAALQFALSKDDWALSIIIAHSLGPSVFTQVCSDYARKCYPLQKAHGTKSLHMMPILMKLFVGNVKDVIDNFVNVPSEGDFARKFHRDIVAAAIVNGASLEFLVEFGKFLADSNMPGASELCFVIGGLLLSRTPLNNGAVFAYVGSFTRTSIYTELYEYLLLTSNLASAAPGAVPATGFPHTFPMKVERAEELADMGAFAASRRYCDFIGGSLRAQTKNPHVNSQVSANFQRLVVRLSDCSTSESGWLGNTLSKVNLDVWGSLDKFLGGEPSSTKPDKGVFSNFSPSVSRNTSQLDISQIPVPVQRLDMHAPHYAGSSAATSGISSPHRGHQSMRYAPQGNQMPQGQVLNYLPKQQQQQPQMFQQQHQQEQQNHQMPQHALKYTGRVSSHVDSALTQGSNLSSPHTRLSISAKERVNQIDSYEPVDEIEHTQRKTSVKAHSRVSSLLSEIHMNPPQNHAPLKEDVESVKSFDVHGDSSTTLKMDYVEEVSESVENLEATKETDTAAAYQVTKESTKPVESAETAASTPPSAPPVSQIGPIAPPAIPPAEKPQGSDPPTVQGQSESAASKSNAPPSTPASAKPSNNSDYAGMLPTRGKPLRAPRGKRNANPYAPASAQVNKYAPTEAKDAIEVTSSVPDSSIEKPEQASNTIVATQIETRVEITQVESNLPPTIEKVNEKVQEVIDQVDIEKENEKPEAQEKNSRLDSNEEAKISKEEQEEKIDKPEEKPMHQPIPNRQIRAPRKTNPYAPAGAQSQHPQANVNPYAPKKAARSYAPAAGGDAPIAAPNQYKINAQVGASTTASLAAANLDISFDNGAEEVDEAEIKPRHEPLLLNSSNAIPSNSAYLNPFNTSGVRPDRANAALDEFPIPNTPDYTSRANSVVGQPGLYSSRLSQQSALHQQYEVKDDTVVDYVPVPEEDDDEDLPPAKEQKKKFEKIQEEMTRKGGAASNEGGWFKSFLGTKQLDGKPKPTRANLGNANTFKYDEKLRRWIDTSRPLEEQLQEEKLDPPPMMPSMATSSRQPAPGPGAPGPSGSTNVGTSGPSAGPTGQSGSSGPQVNAPSIPTGPTKLEDLLGGKAPARAARKAPRRYVNVINQN